jgi:hypothetical protein
MIQVRDDGDFASTVTVEEKSDRLNTLENRSQEISWYCGSKYETREKPKKDKGRKNISLNKYQEYLDLYKKFKPDIYDILEQALTLT